MAWIDKKDINVKTDQASLMKSTSGTLSQVTNIGTVSALTSGTVSPKTGATWTVTATDLDIRDLTSASDSVAAAQSGAWNVTTTNTSTANAVLQTDNIGLMKTTGGTVTALQGTSPWTVDGTVTSTPSGTQDVDIKTIAGTTLTSGTLDTYTKGRLQSSTVLWSAYNTGTATYTSGASNITSQQIKTLALYITQTSTAVIQVQPVSGASWYDYYTDNAVSSNTYWSKSFTEQAYQVRLAVTPSANSTLDAWFIGQT